MIEQCVNVQRGVWIHKRILLEVNIWTSRSTDSYRFVCVEYTREPHDLFRCIVHNL